MTDDKDTEIARDEREFAEYLKERDASVPNEFLDKYFPNGFTIRDEANAIIAFAVRNGPIEKLHEGVHSELLGNKNVRRITGNEMKEITTFACDKMEWLLRLKIADPKQYYAIIVRYAVDYCYNWDR